MAEKKYHIGYVPGVFDLFHIGHLNLIRRSKEVSDYLIAGVLTDELVYHFKKKYPYIPFEERLEIVGALKEVDEVVKVDFSNTVKMDAWKLYHYDAYFSGSDHGDEWNHEKEALQKVGSDIVFFPYTQGTSSTILKNKLSNVHNEKNIYIMGAGVRGRQMLQTLQTPQMQNLYQVAGFLDNADEKYLTRVEGITVFKPEDVLRLESEKEYAIVVAMKDSNAVCKQLEELGIADRIVNASAI